MKRTPPVVVAVVCCLFSCSVSRAERAGFNFTGALQVFGSGNTTLFGISVPKNSPVKGTFSYDTATHDDNQSPQPFYQSIDAGFTLDINNGAIRLSARDYLINITNDFVRLAPPEIVDALDVQYDSRFSPSQGSILVNDAKWTGPTAYMTLEFSWPSTTFNLENAFNLTSDLPLAPSFSTAAYSLVGSSASSPKPFYITSVSAIPDIMGDFNRDGKQDINDYFEWRDAFGMEGPTCQFADTNGDGVVDAADYVAWRRAAAPAYAPSLAASNVPEPSCFMLFSIALTQLVIHHRRKASCRAFL